MRKTAGATFVELLVSMAVFVMIVGLIFLLFGIGSRGFRTIESRQTAQNHLAAIRAALQRDLQLSHFYGIAVEQGSPYRIAGRDHPRHSLSAVTVSDWDDPANRDDFGVARWDGWAVYRVSREDKGQLLRHTVRPAGAASGRALLRPADGLPSLALATELHNVGWSRVGPPQVLARGVRSMTGRLDQEQRAVEVAVTVEQLTDPKNPKADVLTASFYIKPHNTVPAD